MREIWADYNKWLNSSKQITIGTVVHVGGSSLRPAGSKIIFNNLGEISGSVSGGCVEGAVYEEAQGVASIRKPRLVSYGVSDESAWEVGLSCGGTLKVFVDSMTSPSWQTILPGIRESVENNKAAALITVLTGSRIGNKLLVFMEGGRLGTLGSPDVDQQILSQLPKNWASSDPEMLSYVFPEGNADVFVEYLLPPLRMIIIGAVHIAMPLVTLANTMNFHTIVIDARRAFASHERFPHADELIVEWPAKALEELNLDPGTCVVCLSHDEKQDNPALIAALKSKAFYIGALGSNKTHEKRIAALREEGITEEQIHRIHAPVGLKIGGKQPAEIALSIMAEIIAEQHGGIRI